MLQPIRLRHGEKSVIMKDKQTAIAEAPKLASDNISPEDFLALRTAKFAQDYSGEDEAETELEEESEVDDDEIPDDESEEIEDDSEEEESEEVDLLSLTTEQIQELAKKGKSRLLHRIGELTAKNKALEDRLTTQPDQKTKIIPQSENPFRDLKTVELVNSKTDEIQKLSDECERLLEEYEDLGSDDIITLGDRQFTKKEIRVAARNSRDALLKFLPAQHAEIKRGVQLGEMETQYNAAVISEVPELADSKSELSKQYKSMMADPLIEQVRALIPDLAPQMGYLIGHALKSLSRNKAKKSPVIATEVKTKAKVPSNPFGAAAGKSPSKNSVNKEAESAYKKFEESGSEASWIAARIAKFS